MKEINRFVLRPKETTVRNVLRIPELEWYWLSLYFLYQIICCVFSNSFFKTSYRSQFINIITCFLIRSIRSVIYEWSIICITEIFFTLPTHPCRSSGRWMMSGSAKRRYHVGHQDGDLLNAVLFAVLPSRRSDKQKCG
jgi:hypothetical protein